MKVNIQDKKIGRLAWKFESTAYQEINNKDIAFSDKYQFS